MNCFKNILILAVLLPFTALSADFGEKYGEKVDLYPDTGEYRIWMTDWSPDGAWIAFGYMNDIWIVPAGGGEPANLTEDIVNICARPKFSPNGEEIAFTMYSQNRDEVFKTVQMNIRTREYRLFMDNAVSATYSRDGRFLAYIKNDSCHAVYDLQTGEETVYPVPDGFTTILGRPTISPDNSAFVAPYTSQTVRVWQLVRVPFDRNEPPVMLINSDWCWFPEYSPDGEWLLSTKYDMEARSGNDQKKDIVLYHLPTAKTIIVIRNPDPGVNTYHPGWSPDGRKFCYIADDGEKSLLYVYSFDAWKALETGVIEEEPVCFTLRGNYPNPFNQSTTIEFSLNIDGFTRLDVYNTTGQRIRTLVSQYLYHGPYTFCWDGCDDSGYTMSSGVYVVNLKVNNTSVSEKMLMMK